MRVGFATTDWSPIPDENGHNTLGGSGWYRVGIPSKALSLWSAHGVSVGLLASATVRSTGGRRLGVYREDGTHDWDCDVIVLQRWMHDGLADDIRLARASGQVIINDVDDWFFGLSPANAAFHSSHPKVNPEANRNHYRQILAASSLITVSTPFLADRFREMFNGRVPVEVLPNVVDLGPFGQDWRVRPLGEEDPVVGWAGAVAWRSGDLEVLRGVLGPWAAANPTVRFHHSGHHEFIQDGVPLAGFAERVGLPADRVTTSEMVAVHDVPRLYDAFNVLVAPLNDLPFNQAKSWIKVLEASAAGLPAVASPLPAYVAAETEGLCVVARKPAQWRRHLDRLADPDERAMAGKAAREAAEGWAAHRRWGAWREVYESVDA
jgi:glycosyltransferase involved in cell wall biosynthesis